MASTLKTSPQALIDTLNSLLEAELNSVFRFLEDGTPYLNRAAVEVRQPLNEMIAATRRRSGDLYALIESLGGVPVTRSLQNEEQYLAFLSLQFLLPKLVEAEELMVTRYQGAIRSIGTAAAPEAMELLQQLESEHNTQLATLKQAAAHVAGH